MELSGFVHVLTHKDLHLHPVIVGFPAAHDMPSRSAATAASEPTSAGAWFAPHEWPRLGLPAPIRKLLAGEKSGEYAG